MRGMLSLAAAIMSMTNGFKNLDKGAFGNYTSFNPRKDRTKCWDKLTRNRNKLNLNSIEQEKLSSVHGKMKKNYLKMLHANSN